MPTPALSGRATEPATACDLCLDALCLTIPALLSSTHVPPWHFSISLFSRHWETILFSHFLIPVFMFICSVSHVFLKYLCCFPIWMCMSFLKKGIKGGNEGKRRISLKKIIHIWKRDGEKEEEEGRGTKGMRGRDCWWEQHVSSAGCPWSWARREAGVEMQSSSLMKWQGPRCLRHHWCLPESTLTGNWSRVFELGILLCPALWHVGV